MTIIYITNLNKRDVKNRLLNKLKIEKINDKTIIYLPIMDNSSKRKKIKAGEKLIKYLLKNNIKAVVISNNLEDIKTELRKAKIKIIDGTILNKFLIQLLIKKIFEYKSKTLQIGEITFLINNTDDIIIKNIQNIAQKMKKINIITTDINKLKKTVDDLYDELGIIIRISNNFRINIENSDIIVNLDFTEKMVNECNIPRNTIIINLPKNININQKKFSGINIKDWRIDVPKEYRLEGFNEYSVYEADIYGRTTNQIFEKIQKDNIKIINLIGKNGIIKKQEFLNLS